MRLPYPRYACIQKILRKLLGMKMLKAIFDLFTRRLRLSNPWNYKVPVLIAVTYLVMLHAGFDWVEGWVGFAFSVCTIIGIAGFGYLSNDLGDRDADRKAGKANLLLEYRWGRSWEFWCCF
jgi:4-hydroxybenzoate polyprenyltransferase